MILLLWSTGKSISTYNDSVFVSKIFNDTIFELKNQNIIPRYAFNFGKQCYPIENAKDKVDFGDINVIADPV